MDFEFTALLSIQTHTQEKSMTFELKFMSSFSLVFVDFIEPRSILY